MSRRTGLVVLGITAASVVATEVLLTRLLSVTTWYSLAFLVLSLAMLGTTSGALWASRARERGEALRPYLAEKLVLLSASLLLLPIIVLSTPLLFTLDATSFGALLFITAVATLPMTLGAAVVARIMSELPAPLATLYAIDLVCAAGGALLPLLLLAKMSGPGALVAVSLSPAACAIALAAPKSRAKRGGAVFAMLAVALVLTTELTSRGLVVRYTKGAPRESAKPIFEAWNPLSHVTLTAFAKRPFPLWSPGKGERKDYPVANAVIDGEAGTVVYAYGAVERLEPLKSDATTVAHALRSTGPACVIGVGGGRDLLAALLYGHDRVLGVEINPAMVDMLKSVSAYSPLVLDPRVEIVLGDGRTEINRRKPSCRVLQASLVDTWAATSAGAFAHTESTLYTREAWAGFLKRVEPDGILTFSRWYEPTRPSEASRLVALTVASLIDRGVTSPRDHVALISAGKVATLMVSPAPLTTEDREKLAHVATERGFDVLAAPGQPATDAVLDQLLSVTRVDALAAVGRPRGLDTTAPTDDRPFFFQLLLPSAWLRPVAVTHVADVQGALSGNVAATFELVLTLLAVLVLASVLLGPTLVRAWKEESPPLPGGAAVIYFGALGGGFMLAEIALVQRMHVVLGHPTYALVVVLCGLLVATGVGSALSARLLKTKTHVRIAAAACGVLLIVLPYAVVGPLARSTLDATFAVRAAWTGGVAGLVGLGLGMLFPGGLAYADRERGASVALAVNGATGVVGSVLAVLISVGAGIPVTFVCAGLLYLLAATFAPPRWRPLAKSSPAS